MSDESVDVTGLLNAWTKGDPEALDRLLPVIMDEVRGLARRVLAQERADVTLQPTELVNEAYLRLVDRKAYWWRSRKQFFAALAQLMRRILVDRARRRLAAKRGGGARRLTLDEGVFAGTTSDPALVLLDDALEELKTLDRRKYQIVMLVFFVGMKQHEIAKELAISVNTVARNWQAARAWLQHAISTAGSDG